MEPVRVGLHASRARRGLCTLHVLTIGNVPLAVPLLPPSLRFDVESKVLSDGAH